MPPKNKTRVRRRRKPSRLIPDQPIMVRSGKIRSEMIEFAATGGGIPLGFDVTRLNIMCWVVTAANVAANVVTYGLYQGIRIRQVDIWGMPSDTLASTVSLEFYGQLGSGLQLQKSQLGTTSPAKLRCVPPRGSSADSWTDLSSVVASTAGTAVGQGGEIIMNLRFNMPGVVIQVHYDYIDNVATGATNLTSTVSATVITEGLRYFPAMNFSGQTGVLNVNSSYRNSLPAL
jgi:hypothetical protein